MEFLTALWLPILLNAVALFFASFVAWTVLPHHFSDWKKLDKEEEVMDAAKRMKIPPGNYMFPQASSKAEQAKPEYQELYKRGPRGVITIFEYPNMKHNLIKTFVFFLVTSTVIGYITHFACPPGASGVDFMRVFRIAGTIGILTHASSGWLNSIWFKRRVITDTVDGIAYGIIIGLIFAMLWPAG